nr:hypothetical protein [Tanacetum cinerariifolium]
MARRLHQQDQTNDLGATLHMLASTSSQATVRDALRLDDAEGVECLPNEEIFAELARMGVGKRCSGVETPLFEGMIVEQQVDEVAAEVNVKDVSTAGVVAEGDVSAADDVVPTAVEEPSIPSPTPPTPPPQPSQDIPSTSHVQITLPQSPQAQPHSPQHQPQPSQDAGISMDLLQNLLDTCKTLTRRGRIIANMDADKDVTVKDVVAKDDVDLEPAKLQEVVEVVTTAKLIIKVGTAASATITTATLQLTTAPVPTLSTAPSAARRRKGVVIRDPEESATPSIIIHFEAKSKDKGKGILVDEPKPLKKQAQIEQDEAYARELEADIKH